MHMAGVACTSGKAPLNGATHAAVQTASFSGKVLLILGKTLQMCSTANLLYCTVWNGPAAFAAPSLSHFLAEIYISFKSNVCVRYRFTVSFSKRII